MSWTLKKKVQTLVAGEEGVVRKDWGGRVSIALVYPNTYAVGMSNLGFQTIYEHLNRLPHVVCERVFFPDPGDIEEYRRTGTAPFSLESQRPLRDFDLIGFSVTYEGDYINVVRLLRMAGVPARAADRQADDPVVIMGGVCAFSNPEPVAPFMDVVVVGEGEEVVGEIVEAWRGVRASDAADPRRRFVESLLPLGGIYVPEAYAVRYAAEGGIESVVPMRPDAPAVVGKRRLRDVNAFQTRSIVKTPKAEYGHMQLLEVGKGCGRGCRFCLEGQVYRPVRHRSLESLRASVAEIAKDSKRVGLVGACVSDYPWIGDLMQVLEEYGVEVSISSLRADSLTEDLVASLQRGGHRTLTVAPEAGTERLRGVVRKVITDAQLYAACDLLRKYGIPNLKCYFMIGLPTETEQDVLAIVDLAARMLDRLRVLGPDGHPFGKLTLSVSSFVPKPWTPFQWAAFEDPRVLEAKLDIIKRGAGRLSVRVVHENPREAGLQALLARGDRRVADLIEMAACADGDWRRALREWDGDPLVYTQRVRGSLETFPWDHFEVGVRKAGLLREWERAVQGDPVRV
ncbi:MAG TPA: radical SAM protein [Candidatus Methylomirabilis sp.]|nr:radical SAM protein [Candidatus Methylomirabilis sp.]